MRRALAVVGAHSPWRRATVADRAGQRTSPPNGDDNEQVQDYEQVHQRPPVRSPEGRRAPLGWSHDPGGLVRFIAVLTVAALGLSACSGGEESLPDEPEAAGVEVEAESEPEPEPAPEPTELLKVEATTSDLSNFGSAGDQLTLTFSSGVSEGSMPVVQFGTETPAVCWYSVECEFDDNVVTMTWVETTRRGPRDLANASVTELKDTTDVNGFGVQMSEPVPVTKSEPEPEPPPANVRYDSVYDLREQVEEAGLACNAWAIIANPDGATERATCSPQVVLSIYENASEVQRSVDRIAEMSLAVDLSSNHVVGPNWSVNCGAEADLCTSLWESLGGEIDSREP